MNPDLELLQPYPFARLAELLANVVPNESLKPLRLSIGEPQHGTPHFISQALTENLDGYSRYPETAGSEELRNTIKEWLSRRYGLDNTFLTHTSILPVNGTREALFAIAQLIIDRTKSRPLVGMPNPFYQIYEGAALLAGAQPLFLNCTRENSYLADLGSVEEVVWQDVQLVYICNPGNPSGVVMSSKYLQHLLHLADKHDFAVISDECYAELYYHPNPPPTGLLEVCREIGRTDFSRCLVFHSLSKRSSVPGLRSGFVAGDASLIQRFLQYRTYHGSAMPLPTQMASCAAWQDESHVQQNRDAYAAKYTAVLPILQEVFAIDRPQAGFYFWLNLGVDDQEFTRTLYQQENLVVLPGSYLARETTAGNPGKNHIRLALVGSLEDCVDGAERLVRCYQNFNQ